MDTETLAILVPIAVALIMGIPGILSYRAQHRKSEAEIEKTEAETAEIIQRIAGKELEGQRQKTEECMRMIKTLKAQVNRLKTDMKNLMDHYANVVEGAHMLLRQVRKYEEPCYTPPPIEIIDKRRKSLED